MFKKKTLKTFLISSLALISSSYAQSNMSFSSFKGNQNQNTNSNFFGSVSMQHNQLMSDVGETVGNEYFAELDFRYYADDGFLTKKLTTSARINDENQLMYSLQETYLKYKFENSTLAFGRVVLPWSQLDSTWSFGHLNNRRNFDQFEPGVEGLAGVSYVQNFKGSGLTLSAFVSPIYIPEMNPGQTIDKKNGKIICENPWCKPVSDSAPIEGRNVPIFYNVDYPEISDVIFRYSTGARLSYENNNKSLEISSFIMRKPENEISVSAQISLDVDEDIIYADVKPEFYYHDVYGAEIKVRPYNFSKKSDTWLQGITLYGSALSIRPERFPDGEQQYIEYTGIKPEKIREDYIGGGISFENKWVQTALSYVARTSEYDIKNEILSEAPRFNQALNLKFNARLTGKLSAGFDIKTDMLTEDRITMFKANYELSPSLTTSVGVNMIGVSDSKSYWAEFENNDQVYASLKYIF